MRMFTQIMTMLRQHHYLNRYMFIMTLTLDLFLSVEAITMVAFIIDYLFYRR